MPVTEEIVRRVMSKEWWGNNAVFLSALYNEAYSQLGTGYLLEADKRCDVIGAVSRDEDVQKRGITKNEIIVWQTIRLCLRLPVKIKITT